MANSSTGGFERNIATISLTRGDGSILLKTYIVLTTVATGSDQVYKLYDQEDNVLCTLTKNQYAYIEITYHSVGAVIISRVGEKESAKTPDIKYITNIGSAAIYRLTYSMLSSTPSNILNYTIHSIYIPKL